MTNYFYPICIFYRNFKEKEVELWKLSHRLEGTPGMKLFLPTKKRKKSWDPFQHCEWMAVGNFIQTEIPQRCVHSRKGSHSQAL